MELINTVRAAVLGHAIGDALGVPVEFVTRDELQKHPVTDMLAYGTYNVPKGTWSDDTSMTLCTLNSITVQGKIDLEHIMSELVKWVDDGHMTPHGKVFDIGRTCLSGIMNYQHGKGVHNCGCNREFDNGNGSLMRIIPISLYNFFKRVDREAAIDNINAVSALTHAHDRSCIACGIYDFVIQELLAFPQKSSVKIALKKAYAFYDGFPELKHFERLCSPDFGLIADKEIKSSGYVVDTLEAAIWCLLTANSYKECVLKAVNLGQDTDTVAAVAGGLAGLLYGYKQIPAEWIKTLAKHNEIIKMCDAFYAEILDK